MDTEQVRAGLAQLKAAQGTLRASLDIEAMKQQTVEQVMVNDEDALTLMMSLFVLDKLVHDLEVIDR